MKILVLGSDGYIGHALCGSLKKDGHYVKGYDNFSRRKRASSGLFNDRPKTAIHGDVMYCDLYEEYDVIVHLAEQPSAPWSMDNRQWSIQTQHENVLGTLNLLWEMREKNPDAHLIKLGTLGEYGYSHGVQIPDGFIPGWCIGNYLEPEKCPLSGMRFPPNPNSFYHLSKVYDSMNIEFACKTWGLRSTDIMQGIVFGHNYWDDSPTRFDYDQYFGTAINRFVAQSVSGIPLTVYGEGGQSRGYLPLSDSIECIIRVIENPPQKGEYRVFNQFAKIYTINELAETIRDLTGCEIQHIPNPRNESEDHPLSASNDGLRKIGYNPQWNLKEELEKLLYVVGSHADNINRDVIMPTHKW